MKILDDLDSKEKKIYIGVAVGLLVIGATGFLLWRINQEEKLSSEESEAAGSVVCGGECVNDSDCIGWNNGSGNVECNQGGSGRCEIFKCSSGQVIGPSKCACTPVGGIACGDYGCATDGDCAGGGITNAQYECSDRTDGDVSKQQCVRLKCPTGYEIGDDNCSCELTVVNTCDGGGWVKKPTEFSEDESFTMSGYGQDTDGINLSSISVKINNTTLSSSKITKKEDSSTKASWSTTLSGYTPGEYTTTVVWEDKEGNSSDDCTLSATFTVTEAEEEKYCVNYWTVKDNSCQENEKCSVSEDISIEISGTATFSSYPECQIFMRKDYWQVSDNQCVEVSNVESALEKYYTSGLVLFESLSACQATLEDGEGEEETTSPVTTTTPQTGILDEAWGKIALGFTVLAMGMIFVNFDMFEVNWNGVRIERENLVRKEKRKKKGNSFEREVVKRK